MTDDTTGNQSQSNTSSECTDVGTILQQYYLPVMYVIIFSVGLVGNVTSITIYVMKMRPWKSNSVIMLNLALTDLLYVSSLPFLAYYYMKGNDWTLGPFMCRFVRFVFHFNLYGSILFLTCLSTFRYMVVVYPLKTQVHRQAWGVVACAVIWAVSTTEIIPMVTMINLNISNNKTNCLDLASNDPVQTVWWYSWVLTVLGYLLPLVLNCIFYYLVMRTLAKGPHTHCLHRLRARRLSVIILVVLTVCFMPFHVLRAARVATRMWPVSCNVSNWVQAGYIISRPIAGLNTFFNLALYTLAGDKFQQAFLSVFTKGCCIPEVKGHVAVAVVARAGIDRPKADMGPTSRGQSSVLSEH